MPSFLFPEAISLKQVIFILMTLGYFVVALPAVLKYEWVERACIAGTLFMAINPVDVTFFSYTNYRGDIRGIEFGVTDWLTLTLVYAMFYAPRWRRRKLYYRSPNDIIMWAYLLLCTLTIFTAVIPQFAFFGVTRIIRGYLLFWVALNYLRTEEDARFVVYCIAGLAIYSFVQVLMDKYVRGVFPPVGSFPHQNTLATFQNVMNFIVFAALMGDKGKIMDKRNKFYWIALGGGTLTTLATLSRGGMATMFMGYGIIFGGLILLKAKKSVSVKKWRVVGLMFLAALPVLAFVLPPIIDRFINAPEASAEARHVFNDVAAELGERQFFGVGLNNYSFVGTTEYAEVLGPVDAGGLAHHIYWLHYAELGVLGPTLWTLMMVGFIFHIARTVNRKSQDFEGILALGILSGFIVAMLIGTLEWNFRQSQMTLTYMMLAGFGLSLGRVREERFTTESKQRRKRLALIHWLSQRTG